MCPTGRCWLADHSVSVLNIPDTGMVGHFRIFLHLKDVPSIGSLHELVPCKQTANKRFIQDQERSVHGTRKPSTVRKSLLHAAPPLAAAVLLNITSHFLRDHLPVECAVLCNSGAGGGRVLAEAGRLQDWSAAGGAAGCGGPPH